MKATYFVHDGLKFDIDAETEADLFKNLATIQETFTAENCGLCKAPSKFLVRKDKEENEYFELACTDLKCRARLPYGQMKKPKGKLYPKRHWNSLSDAEKTNRGPEPKSGYLPNGGWYKWNAKAAPAKDSEPAVEVENGKDIPF